MFYHNDPKDEKVLPNGVVRTVKGYINGMMICELKWKKGMVGDVHTHPHVQGSYVVSGSFEASYGDEKQIIRAGDTVYFESNAPHGMVCLEDDSVLLDIFTPYREDFV